MRLLTAALILCATAAGAQAMCEPFNQRVEDALKKGAKVAAIIPGAAQAKGNTLHIFQFPDKSVAVVVETPDGQGCLRFIGNHLDHFEKPEFSEDT